MDFSTSTGETGNLKLSAYRNITWNGGDFINPMNPAAPGKVNITLDANDTGASGGGSIYLQAPPAILNQQQGDYTITSNGGNITLGGGTNPLTGYAVGDNAPGVDIYGNPVYSNGVTIEGTQIIAGTFSNTQGYGGPGGNITINGKGYSFTQDSANNISRGVYADPSPSPNPVGPNTPLIETYGSGNITINGVGGNAGSGTSYGVDIEGYGSDNTRVFTENGNIAITGIAGSAATSAGVNLISDSIAAGESLIGPLPMSLTITGTGGNSSSATATSDGIYALGASMFSAGPVMLYGTGGTASTSTGVLVDYPLIEGYQGSLVKGLAGDALVSGIGVEGESTGSHITFHGNSAIIGGGIQGASNYSGVVFNTFSLLGPDASYPAGTGTVAITGKGGVSAGNTGIEIDNGTTFFGGNFILTGSTGAPGTAAIEGNLMSGGPNCFTNIGGCYTFSGEIYYGSSNVTFLTDTLNLFNTVVYGYNNISFLPKTASTTIGVGGGAGTLQLSSGLLESIYDTSNVTIGSSSDTGAMTIGSTFWNNSYNYPYSDISGTVSLLNGSGNITLAGVTSTDANDSITVSTLSGDFINQAGAGALAPGSGGRFLIYTTGPANDTLDGLGYNFTQYGCTYGQPCSGLPPTGNGLVFSQASR